MNDHLLKGADIFPGVVTGKLSDFAGLFVAPALLCVLVRARSRRAVILAHAATAIVFALVKTVPLATLAFERVLSLVVASHAWTDPTDLVALPMVLVAHRVLVPVMTATDDVRQGWLARLATVAGSVMCMATSAPALPQLTVNNTSSHTLQVTIRSTDAELDSEVVHSKTPLPIRAAIFNGTPTSVVVQPNTKATPAVSFPELALVLLDDSSTNVHRRFAVASRNLRTLEIRELPGGELTLGSDNTIDVRDLDKSEPCATKPFAKTYSMSLPDVPYGEYTIASSTPELDGCIILGFEETATEGKVCLPEDVWPFQVGDKLLGSSSQVAHDRDGLRTVVIVERRSSSMPLVTDPSCAMVDACNAIAFSAKMPVGDGTLLSPGDDHTYTKGEMTIRTIAGNLSRSVLVPTCAASSTGESIGDHANYVIVTTAPVPPSLGSDAGADADADASSDAGTD